MNTSTMQHRTVGFLGILALLTLLPACSANQAGSETVQKEETKSSYGLSLDDSTVALTSDIPDSLFCVTARQISQRSDAEDQKAIAEIGTYFGYDVLWDDGTVYDSGRTEYPTSDGGSVIYGGAFQYFSGGYVPCAVSEMQGEAKRVEVVICEDGMPFNQSYTLDGEGYSVNSAVDYVQALWNDCLASYSTAEKVRVSKVLIYEQADGTYAFVLLMDKYMEGLPIEQYSTLVQAVNDESGGFRKSFVIAEMTEPDKVAYCCDYYPFEIVSEEVISGEILTAEEALQKANQVIARYTDYTIYEYALRYGCTMSRPAEETDEEWNNKTFTYQPYWCFVLEWADPEDCSTNDPSNYLPNVTLYIDAQTGAAYLLDSIYFTEMQSSA